MKFLKKNWVQGITLALCVVLLAVAVKQYETVQRLQLAAELMNDLRKGDLAEQGALEQRVAELERLQTAQEPTRSVQFSNPSVNTRDRMLTVDIAAEIPDARGATLDIGFCQVGEPYRLAWKQEYLHREENGTYTQTVTFPLDLEMGLELCLEDDTVLFSSDSITPLLPVQLAHGGASWHYDSTLRQFYLLDCVPGLTDLQGQEIEATDGVCRVYRNGKLVIEDTYFRGRDNLSEGEYPEEGFSLPCAPGDRIRLCYVCTDEFGLRYEFPLGEWVAQRWDDAEEYPLSGYPTVIWPQ